MSLCMYACQYLCLVFVLVSVYIGACAYGLCECVGTWFLIDLSEVNEWWSVGWCMEEAEREGEGERQRVVGTQ